MLAYLLLAAAALGQIPANNVRPQIGYVYPPGGKPGTTVEVRLGTYDWTPDMQVFAHDGRIKIEITGTLSEPILTPPPYWFGQKAGQAQPPLPRELPAKITIPADFPPGPIFWQAANANGGTNVGKFIVGDGAEVVESESPPAILDLPALPAAVSGRISKITEMDTYRFTVADGGLVVCRLDDRLGQPFHGMLTIRDAAGKLVADKADTTGEGATVLFLAQAGATYTATVGDVEYAGDRGYVYRLSLARGPLVVASLPLVLKRGESRPVEFVGYGLASGKLQLESATHTVAVPADAAGESFSFAFTTPAGKATATITLDDATDVLEPQSVDLAARQLTVPTNLSGALDQLDPASNMPVDRYQFTAKKGDILHFSVEAARFGSPVDASLAIVSVADGKEIVRSDDLPTSTDAATPFTAPTDGLYDLFISDLSGATPSRAGVYRLVVVNPAEAFDFSLTVPGKFDLPLGGTADLVVKTTRRGTWDEPIAITLEGLPSGVTQPVEPPPPPEPMPAAPGAKKAPKPKKPAPGDIKVPLVSDVSAAAGASLAMLVAKATVGERTIERRVGPVLVATTLKTRCVVKSAVQDGGRIVNRGTTYPADVIIERLEGYEGPVTLQMAATQQRQRRGIQSGTLVVPPGVGQVQYPIFMPEWLETSLTARMILIGVAQVPDPKGNVRHITGVMDGNIVMSLEGALLKVSHEPLERVASIGGRMEIPVRVSRSVRLPEAARVEVVSEGELAGLITADVVTLPANESTAIIKLKLADDARLVGQRTVTIRATALQNGKWPAVSETAVPLVVVGSAAVAAK